MLAALGVLLRSLALQGDGGVRRRVFPVAGITPRRFWRGVIVTVAYSFTAPDSLSSWARTARRTARFTTARFTTARLTARRFTAFLTMRRFTTARLTARRFTAFLTMRRFTTARLTARRFTARLATALFTAFFAKLPSSNHRGYAPRSRLATPPQDVGPARQFGTYCIQLRDLSRQFFRVAPEEVAPRSEK